MIIFQDGILCTRLLIIFFTLFQVSGSFCVDANLHGSTDGLSGKPGQVIR